MGNCRIASWVDANFCDDPVTSLAVVREPTQERPLPDRFQNNKTLTLFQCCYRQRYTGMRNRHESGSLIL